MKKTKKNWQEKEYLSVYDVAEMLDVHQNTVYAMIDQLPHIKFGNVYRFPKNDLMNWLKKNGRGNV